MSVSIADIKNSMKTVSLNPRLMISYYEGKVRETEIELAGFRNKLSFLKKKVKTGAHMEITELSMKVANVKWRSEIRRCITPIEPDQFYLATSSQIASCIAYNNDIEAINRDIKSKISSTLSLMFREKEIGRYGGTNGKDYFYGVKEFFESDMVTLKKEYLNRLDELEQYQ